MKAQGTSLAWDAEVRESSKNSNDNAVNCDLSSDSSEMRRSGHSRRHRVEGLGRRLAPKPPDESSEKGTQQPVKNISNGGHEPLSNDVEGKIDSGDTGVGPGVGGVVRLTGNVDELCLLWPKDQRCSEIPHWVIDPETTVPVSDNEHASVEDGVHTNRSTTVVFSDTEASESTFSDESKNYVEHIMLLEGLALLVGRVVTLTLTGRRGQFDATIHAFSGESCTRKCEFFCIFRC
jgi:hypothetical protein